MKILILVFALALNQTAYANVIHAATGSLSNVSRTEIIMVMGNRPHVPAGFLLKTNMGPQIFRVYDIQRSERTTVYKAIAPISHTGFESLFLTATETRNNTHSRWEILIEDKAVLSPTPISGELRIGLRHLAKSDWYQLENHVWSF